MKYNIPEDGNSNVCRNVPTPLVFYVAYSSVPEHAQDFMSHDLQNGMKLNILTT
jgi:hypothetical protein